MVFDDPNVPMQKLAAVIIDPMTAFITVGETSVTLTLDLDGNGERKLLSGWFLST